MPRMPRLEHSNAIYHIVARGDYAYSSFGGYARKSRQVDWIAYDEHHRYWLGSNGGKNPSLSYRTFVKEGLVNSTDPKVQRFKDRVYGE